MLACHSGRSEQFFGEGTINDGLAPNDQPFKFMLWAGDDTIDSIRVKIWYEDNGETVIYDNGVQDIAGGSIIIHSGKRH